MVSLLFDYYSTVSDPFSPLRTYNLVRAVRCGATSKYLLVRCHLSQPHAPFVIRCIEEPLVSVLVKGRSFVTVREMAGPTYHCGTMFYVGPLISM
jgi:hypothetical protein